MASDDCKTPIEELEIIREEYEKLAKKYSLPSFKELDEDFEISKAEFSGTTILRDMRKLIIAKFASMMNFAELLLNPSNGSMFHMFLTRGISSEDKEILSKIFGEIGEIEIDSFALELNYGEKNEAEFIKKSFSQWQEMKPEFEQIFNSLKINWKKSSIKKEKSYF